MAANRLRIKWKKDTKMVRVEHQQFLATKVKGKIYAVKWKDNKCVIILSSKFGALPTVEVERWAKTDPDSTTTNAKAKKERKKFPCPAVIDHYNKKMGGVDVLDQLMEYYRTFIKTRKWTLKCFLHFFDLDMTNAWLEYRSDCRRAKISKKDTLDLLAFRLAVAEALVHSPAHNRVNYSSESLSSDDETPRSSNWRAPLPGIDKRTDGYDHWPTVDELTTARMCRNTDCKSRTRFRCQKCNVYLCLTGKKNCFTAFHK